MARDQADRALCDRCRARLLPADALCCPVCRGRIPYHEARIPAKMMRCHPQAQYIVYAALPYHTPGLPELIHLLKFERRKGIAKDLGTILAEGIAQWISECDSIVPIPLSLRRLRDRGFNQAEEIAESIATRHAVPMRANVLIRVKHAVPQSLQRSYEARRKALKDAFAVADGVDVRGQTIVLVDDVWTSGATIEAASKALLGAGARRIIAAVIARAS